MVAKLIAEEGKLKGLTLTLQGGNEWIIGRDPDACQLLVDDPSTSRKHSVCKKTPKGFIIENLSDSTPTKVNNKNLQGPHVLTHGDSVTIGNGIFRFVMDNEVGDQSNFDETIPETDIEKEENPFADETSEFGAGDEDEKPQVKVNMNSDQKNTNPKKSSGHDASNSSGPAKNHSGSSSPYDEEDSENTIFDEFDEGKEPEIAEIDFGIMESGRWLLKVISGPNNGAEFNMQTGQSYTIGTDPSNCDIVFHDTSVSRQHAKISIDDRDIISIQDMQSRNGTIIEGDKVQGLRNLEPNAVVTMGTTSFIVYDREGEMQTIISPLLPDIVKKLTKDSEAEKRVSETYEDEGSSKQIAESHFAKPVEEILPPKKKENTLSTIIIGAIIFGIFSVVGFGIFQLFKEEPVIKQEKINADEEINSIMKNFPSVSFFYTPKNGSIQLVGHVLESSDKARMMYDLRALNFIKNIDETGVVVDSYEVREFSQILEKTKWKSINLIAPAPGKFILSGTLKTRAEADQLNDYINSNFNYVDLLEKKVFVDEEVINSVQSALQKHGINDVSVKLDNKVIILAGGVAPNKLDDYKMLLKEFKKMPEIREVKDLVSQFKAEESLVNISDRYKVTGTSKSGNKLNVVINGRILFAGDNLDGMTVKEIRNNSVILEKGNVTYRIDF